MMESGHGSRLNGVFQMKLDVEPACEIGFVDL